MIVPELRYIFTRQQLCDHAKKFVFSKSDMSKEDQILLLGYLTDFSHFIADGRKAQILSRVIIEPECSTVAAPVIPVEAPDVLESVVPSGLLVLPPTGR